MKKRNIFLLTLSLMTAVVFTACGTNQSTPQTETSAAVEAESQAEAETAEAEETQEDEGTMEAAAAAAAEETGTENAEPMEEKAEVQNNGGHFVKVGDYIYFRMPTPKQLAASALWGEYADMYIPGGAEILAYNPETEEVINILLDDGYGSIVSDGEYLYMQESNEDGQTGVYRIRPDGSDKTVFDEIEVCDAVDDLVILSGYDKKTNAASIHIYKDTELVDSVVPMEFVDEAGNACAENNIIEYVGLADRCIIYKTLANADNKLVYSLWSHNLDDQSEIYLGQIPDYDEYTTAGYSVIDQFASEGGKIYLGLGYYGGTGHMYYGTYYVSADPTAAESLAICELDTAENEPLAESEAVEDPEAAEESLEEEPSYTAFYVADGKLIEADGVPGTAAVEPASGKLCYYDENGNAVYMNGDYSVKSEDNLENMLSVELAELVDGNIFLIQNQNTHVKEDDIGWRYAYKRNEAYTYRVDTALGEPYRVTVTYAAEEAADAQPQP